METIITDIDIKVIEDVQGRIQDAIHYFKTFDRSAKDIKIYMPEYFNRMFCYHKCMPPVSQLMTEYHGIKVVDGYENKVIISVKNNVIYSIKPIKIKL